MINERWLRKITSLLENRFAALCWPLSSIPERVAATTVHQIMNERASGTRFPVRAIRYWWVRQALLREIQNRDGETLVADMGCSRGHMKLFAGSLPSTRWIGLDWAIDQVALSAHGYSELYQCDFDKVLPLPDNSVDIVKFLHVIEHLPRPEFTISEIARILRPGGLLLAGSPVLPAPLAKVREWQFGRRLKQGKIRPGGHIKSMDCRRWRNLLERVQMDVELQTGAFFSRWSGSPLENYSWWLRLNLLWGALFPSLGGEIYLSARKAPAGSAASRVD